MLVLLDERTWTSGEDTAQLVEHIHSAMRSGVHMICVHEFPSVVGPPRHECEFDKMFHDDWTPAHLTQRPTNLYNEAALTLKGVEWRKPGLVAFAFKLAANAGERQPIEFDVPEAYHPKVGPNPWRAEHGYDAANVSGARASLGPAPMLPPPPTSTDHDPSTSGSMPEKNQLPPGSDEPSRAPKDRTRVWMAEDQERDGARSTSLLDRPSTFFLTLLSAPSRAASTLKRGSSRRETQSRSTALFRAHDEDAGMPSVSDPAAQPNELPSASPTSV